MSGKHINLTTSEMLFMDISPPFSSWSSGGTRRVRQAAVLVGPYSKRVRKTCSDPYVYCRSTLCGINAFGIAEIAKGLSSCAEQIKSRE